MTGYGALTGNHSALGESKIRPAVLNLVAQLHLAVEEKTAGSFFIRP